MEDYFRQKASYAYIHSSRLASRRRFSFARFFASVLLLIFLFFGLRTFGPKFFSVTTGIVSPLATTLGSQSDIASLAELESQIKALIETQRGSWSVYFVDYTTNQRFGINEQVIHTAASVNKLYILASLYYLAGKGEIDLDDTITLQRKDIADYGTGVIRYDPPGTVYSLKTLARLLIEKSDNSADNILRLRIGDSRIQRLIDEEFGMRQTSITNNKTSLADVELLLAKMRNGEITNKALTPEMIDLLDKSDFEDRLPALLPSGVRIYHKIGNEVGNIHDVGFFVNDDIAYFLGVFSTDIGDTEDEAKKTIAEISKLVYDFKTSSK